MNGQLPLSRNRQSPLPRPRSPSTAAVTGRGAVGSQSKQAPEHKPSLRSRGVPLDPGEGREPQPVKDPAPARPRPGPRSDSTRWRARTFKPSEPHRQRSKTPGGFLPRLYLLFHVPQQFLFDCVLRAAHGAAGGREAVPSGPPNLSRALTASLPLSSAPHAQGGAPARRAPRLPPLPPQPLPGARLAPQPSSEPRTDVRRLARPLPTARGGRGGALRDKGDRRGGRLCAPGGGQPRRAPRRPLSWQRAGSSPEGVNPHCERLQPGPYRDQRGGGAGPRPRS